MRLALVDDHVLFRVGVRQVLASNPLYQVVGEAGTAREALRVVDTLKPDVVVLDIGLPGMDGVLVASEVRRRSPGTRILFLTGHADITNVIHAMEAGASGFALKTDGIDALFEALACIQQGRRYLSPVVVDDYSRVMQGSRSPAASVLDVLSRREREIFRMAAACMKAKDIARELCIARKTADTHLYRITRKLGLRNLSELVRLAAGLGMVDTGRTPPPQIVETDA